MESLNSQDSPEGLAYLRLMEHELGYIRASDFKQLSEDIAKYASIVFKNMPTKVRSGKGCLQYWKSPKWQCKVILCSYSDMVWWLDLSVWSWIFFSLFQAVKSLLSGTDNEFFAHYIFMDENMVLPTASGFPLKFSLSGVFAPGAKGGISISPNMVMTTKKVH